MSFCFFPRPSATLLPFPYGFKESFFVTSGLFSLGLSNRAPFSVFNLGLICFILEIKPLLFTFSFGENFLSHPFHWTSFFPKFGAISVFHFLFLCVL